MIKAASRLEPEFGSETEETRQVAAAKQCQVAAGAGVENIDRIATGPDCPPFDPDARLALVRRRRRLEHGRRGIRRIGAQRRIRVRLRLQIERNAPGRDRRGLGQGLGRAAGRGRARGRRGQMFWVRSICLQRGVLRHQPIALAQRGIFLAQSCEVLFQVLQAVRVFLVAGFGRHGR